MNEPEPAPSNEAPPPEAIAPVPPVKSITPAGDYSGPPLPLGPIDVELAPREPRPPRPHPGFWWSLLWILGYLLVTQLTAGVLGAAILIGLLANEPNGLEKLHDPDLAKTPAYAQAMKPAILCAQILGFVGAMVALRLLLGKGWTRVIAWRPLGGWHVLLLVFALPGLVLFSNSLEILLRPVFQQVFGQDDLFGLDNLMELMAGWPVWFAVLTIGVGPALAEELFCRGLLGRGLVGRYGVVGGVLLTSAFFGLMHLEPRQVVFAFLLGIFLHAAYLLTRSLWAPILLHFGNNTLAVVSLHVPALSQLENGLEAAPWPAAVFLGLGGLALVLGVGWALYQTRVRLVPWEHGEPWTPGYPSVAWPPPEYAMKIARPAPNASAWAMVLGGWVIFGNCIGLAVLFAKR